MCKRLVPIPLTLQTRAHTALLAWELVVTEHLMWKYIGIVKAKIKFIRSIRLRATVEMEVLSLHGTCAVTADSRGSSLVPRARPAFRRLQYWKRRKAGRGLGTRQVGSTQYYTHTHTRLIHNLSIFLPLLYPYTLSIFLSFPPSHSPLPPKAEYSVLQPVQAASLDSSGLCVSLACHSQSVLVCCH